MKKLKFVCMGFKKFLSVNIRSYYFGRLFGIVE